MESWLILAATKVSVQPLPHTVADANKVTIAFQIVFGIIGALSVLMFALGGLRYISSQGDPQQVAKAKSTLIYALIGLIVSISAVSIVTLVINRVS